MLKDHNVMLRLYTCIVCDHARYVWKGVRARFQYSLQEDVLNSRETWQGLLTGAVHPRVAMVAGTLLRNNVVFDNNTGIVVCRNDRH